VMRGERRSLAGTLENVTVGCHCCACTVLREVIQELKVHEKRMSLAEFDICVLRYYMREWDRRMERLMSMGRLEQMDVE